MKSFTTLLALASAVNAHMIMRTPIPAGNPDSSPLEGDGSNFPCKTGPGKIDTSKPNVMSVGSPNTLSFTGSATHGGGSCQVSLAKGTTVDKNTKWMVIHSIEGGCPAPNNGNQNLGSDPAGTGASTFQFTIPDHPDLGAGDYTLAWSWHNRIGNREMYMNCAYVQLGGAKKKRYAPSSPPMSKRQSSSLPDMFQANIGNGCTTTEGTDVKYPSPGSSLELGPGGNLAPPVGNCGASGSSPANPVSDSPTTPSSSAAAGAPAASNTVAPVSSATGGSPNNGQYTQQPGGGTFATVGAPSNAASAVATATSTAAGNSGSNGRPNPGQYTQSAPGVFASGAASQSAPAVSAPAASIPAASAPAASAPAASAPAKSAASSVAPVVTPPSAPSAPASSVPAAPVASSAPSTPVSSGQTVAGTKCNNEGAWACASDGKSFQRCASEAWSASIQMAAGMTCVPGISANFAYNTSIGNAAKRDLKSHIARRRHNLHNPSLA